VREELGEAFGEKYEEVDASRGNTIGVEKI